MTDTNDIHFLSSITTNFAHMLNVAADDIRFCGQDSYEVLSLVFGKTFSESDLASSTKEQHESLAAAVREEFEWPDYSAESAKEAIEYALRWWSGGES